MKTIQNHTGINITNSKLQLVEVIYSDGEFILENVDEEYFPEFLNFDEKKTKVISILQNALNEITIRNPLKSKYFSFSLPHNLFNVVQLPIENALLENDLAENIKWEFSVLYPHLNNDDLVIQYLKVNKENGWAIIAGILRKYLEILNDFCDQNNVKFQYLDHSHFASDNLLNYESSINNDSFNLSLYLTKDFISIDLIKNNLPVKFYVYPVKATSEIIPELNQFLFSIGWSKDNQKLISRIYLAGDSVPESLIVNLKDIYGFDISLLDPFDKIKHGKALQNNKNIFTRANSFTSAAGLAFRMI
ncbi:MAG: hypothetical protein NTX22_14580 [Ignavibacteriales bacterium]|nr:hypothetical protein [Ignavibacteriales bacterium]